MADDSLFVINPKGIPPKSETYNYVKNEQFSLYFRNTTFILPLYIFDENKIPKNRQVEFLFSELNIDTFFKQKVFPLLKLSPTNDITIKINDSVFAEILYKHLWPITKENLLDHFLDFSVEITVKNN
tara:strand:+ start:63 stop:443 length:381 start_codon:yes stop_codon:yes gene_type:complete